MTYKGNEISDYNKIMTKITNNKLDTQDIPIISSEEDKLDRSKIVNSIIYAIDYPDSIDRKHSLAIGIEGPWGSGKTSIINLVKNQIESDKDHKDKYAILDFNPWMHMGTEQILVDFFRSISQAIIKGLPDEPEISEKVKDLLTGITISLNLGLVSAQKNFDAKLDEPTLDKQKKDLADILSGLDKKVICIIDDIDRLDADETLLIFKLTKIIANFPNMIFLLAYDRRRTASLINQKLNAASTSNLDDDVGDKFIQKIVQVVRPVPYSEDAIQKEYFMGLMQSARSYSDYYGPNIDVIAAIYNHYIRHFLKTSRDIKRYVTHIDIFMESMNKPNISIKNLFLLECFRISCGEAYERIKDNKEILLPGGPMESGDMEYLREIILRGLKRSKEDREFNARIRAIIHIVDSVPRHLHGPLIGALFSILGCGIGHKTSAVQKRELYVSLCKDWDIYFSSVTHNNTEST